MFNLSPDQWRGHLAMLIFSALVAGSFSLGHIVANDIAPAALNAVRFALSSVLIGLIALVGPGFRRRDFAAPWRYLVLGGLFGLYFVLMFEGLKTAGAVSASAVFTLMPLMAAGFGYILLRQITTRRMALALLAAALGAAWVIFNGDIRAAAALDIGRGEAIYFVGCISHAIYTPMVRRLNRGESAVIFTFGTLIAGSVLLGIIGYGDILATQWSHLPTIVWVTLAYLVVFTTSATFVLMQYAALRLPSAKVLAYTYLTPAWVILWELALGNPPPAGTVFLGVAATVAALFLMLKDEEVS